MKVYTITYYESIKGGRNNLQISRVYQVSEEFEHRLKTFTSTKNKAVDYARRWIKKNGHAL